MLIHNLQAMYLPNGSYRLEMNRYVADGSPAIRLVDRETGAPMMSVTVCMVDHGWTPATGCALIKSWAENTGIVEALTDAGVVTPTGRMASAGYAMAVEVELSPALREALKAFDARMEGAVQ